MRGAAWMIHLSAILCLLVGCSDSPQAPQGNATNSPSSQGDLAGSVDLADTTASLESAGNRPDQVVSQFYQALRSGNSDSIEALLTDKAREETAKSGLAIQSQTSASLAYDIGETDYVTENLDGAHVMSLWAEPDANGELVSTEVIWVLRKQHDGWKISGMATAVADGELPLLFNFENPEDMMMKKAYVESQVVDTSGQLPAVDTGMEGQPANMSEATSTPAGARHQPSVAEIRGSSSISDLR